MANATCPLAEQFQYVVIVKEMLITPQHSDPHWNAPTRSDYIPAMGFNKRKMEDARKTEADKEATARRGLGPQILADARAKQASMLFVPTIGAAIAARHWFLWVRCPACRITSTCAHSTVIPTRRSRALSPRRPADHADRMPLCRTGAAVAIERTEGVERGARQGRVGQVDRCNGVLPVTAELASRR